MASTQTASDTSGAKTSKILTGKENWNSWYYTFKAYAGADGTWSLFDCSERVLLKPKRNDYIQSRHLISGDISEEGTPAEVLRHYFMYMQAMHEYKMALDDYEKQQKRVRRAMKMLLDCIDPSIYSTTSLINQRPAVALEMLRMLYKP